MKHKFLCVIFLLLSVYLFSGCGRQPGSQKDLSLKEEELAQVMDICGHDGKFYLAATDAVIVYDEEGEKLETWELPELGISNVTYGDDLYLLDVFGMQILKLSQKGEVEDHLKLSVSLETVMDFEAVGDTLFLSCTNAAGKMPRECTYRISWETRSCEVFLEETATLAAGAEDILYTEKLGAINQYRISGKQSDATGLRGIGTGKEVDAFCVDEKDNFYYVSEGYLWQTKGNEDFQLHRLQDDYDVIAETGDMLLLLERAEKLTLATKEPEEQKATETLTLYGTGTEFEDLSGNKIDLARDFANQYGIEVKRTADTSMNQDAFLTDLMSGSDKYDIYRFWVSNDAAQNFIRYHAYEDLSASAGIMEELNAWYPVIADACRSENQIVGVPGGVGITLLYYNDRDYSELSAENFQTWDQFLDVLEEYDQPVAFNRIRLTTVLLEQYISSYCDTENGQYHFDTDAFRKVLQLLKRINAMDITYSEKAYDWTNLFQNGEIAGFTGAEGYVYEGYSFVPLPSINGEEPTAPFTMGYHVINPNSQHKEEAFLYMEMLAEQRMYFDVGTAETYPKLADVMNHYAKLVSGSQPDYGTSIDDFLAGEITEDEAITEIEERTDRKVNE